MEDGLEVRCQQTRRLARGVTRHVSHCSILLLLSSITEQRGSAMAEARGTYFIGAEESAEMARLLVQERLLTAGMGGLLAERQQDVTGFHTVIDLACGPGGWAMDLAREHRD